MYTHIPCPSSFCKPSRINERVLSTTPLHGRHFSFSLSFPSLFRPLRFNPRRYSRGAHDDSKKKKKKKKLKVDARWDNREEYSLSSLLFFF